jgi:hypothetical protein
MCVVAPVHLRAALCSSTPFGPPWWIHTLSLWLHDAPTHVCAQMHTNHRKLRRAWRQAHHTTRVHLDVRVSLSCLNTRAHVADACGHHCSACTVRVRFAVRRLSSAHTAHHHSSCIISSFHHTITQVDFVEHGSGENAAVYVRIESSVASKTFFAARYTRQPSLHANHPMPRIPFPASLFPCHSSHATGHMPLIPCHASHATLLIPRTPCHSSHATHSAHPPTHGRTHAPTHPLSRTFTCPNHKPYRLPATCRLADKYTCTLPCIHAVDQCLWRSQGARSEGQPFPS